MRRIRTTGDTLWVYLRPDRLLIGNGLGRWHGEWHRELQLLQGRASSLLVT